MAKFRVPKLRLMDNIYQAPTRTYMMRPEAWCDVTDPKDIAFFRKRRDVFEEEGVPRPKAKLPEKQTVDTSDESPPIAIDPKKK